jgi:methyl-accepting chemotaxis protein
MTRALRQVSTSAKLSLLVAAAMVALAALALDSRHLLEAQLLEERKTEVRAVVEAVDAVLHHFGTLEAGGKLTRAEAQTQAQSLLRSLRYGGKEYVWVNDLHPRMVMHPTRPELDGKDVTQDADPAGKLLFQEFVRVARTRGAGYVDYLWPRPGADQPVRKLSYVQLFEEWGWIVGSGLYLDDVDAAMAEQDRRLALAALGILAALGLVAWLVTRSVTTPLAEAVQVARRIAEGDLTAPGQPSGRDEPARLLEALGKMAQRLRRVVGELASSAAAVSSASGILGEVVRDLSSGSVAHSGGLGRSKTSADVAEAALRRHAEAAREVDATLRRALLDAEELERGARLSPEVNRALVSRIVSQVGRTALQAGELAGLLDRDVAAAQGLAEAAREQARRGGRQAEIVAALASSTTALAEQAEALERAVEFFHVEEAPALANAPKDGASPSAAA